MEKLCRCLLAFAFCVPALAGCATTSTGDDADGGAGDDTAGTGTTDAGNGEVPSPDESDAGLDCTNTECPAIAPDCPAGTHIGAAPGECCPLSCLPNSETGEGGEGGEGPEGTGGPEGIEGGDICAAVDCAAPAPCPPGQHSEAVPDTCCEFACVDDLPEECDLVDCPDIGCAEGFHWAPVAGECCGDCFPDEPVDCTAVLCAEPECEAGFHPEVAPGECCANCVPDEPQDCTLADCMPMDCVPGFVPETPVGQCCPGCVPDPSSPVACAGAEPFFPTYDKTCQADSDCTVGIHTTDCCGNSVAIGMNAAEQARFDADEAVCDAQYPGCGCPAMPTVLEDGTLPGMSATIIAVCDNGACMSAASGP